MLEGYDPDYSEQPDEQLDEFLCEYVDGTMDPSVRAAFEEYLEANPRLAAHARCLCRTRSMLCSYGGRHGGETLEEQIRHRVACELNRKNRSEATLVSRLGTAAMMTSIFSLLLILGGMSGLTQVDYNGIPLSTADSSADHLDSMELPSDNGHAAGRTLPLEWYAREASWSVVGPKSMLPAIDMQPIGWHRTTFDSTASPVMRLAVAP